MPTQDRVKWFGQRSGRVVSTRAICFCGQDPDPYGAANTAFLSPLAGLSASGTCGGSNLNSPRSIGLCVRTFRR